MVIVAERADRVKEFIYDGNPVRTSDYHGRHDAVSDGPQGFLVEIGQPHAIIKPHFHDVNQFQIAVAGSARVGKHAFSPFTVHYVDAYTPYGPIEAGDDGISFFTLRAKSDLSYHIMPGSKHEMKRRSGRSITVPVPGGALPSRGVEVQTLIEAQPDGLEALAVSAAPDTEVKVSMGRGAASAYWMVLSGAFKVGRSRLVPRSSLFVSPGERAPRVVAGPKGGQLVVLRLPGEPLV
jgi:hypothetical protein